MDQDRKKIKREKKRLKFIREQKENRSKSKKKYNIDFNSPRSRDIGFEEKK